MSSYYSVGSLVKHIHRPDVDYWVVIGATFPSAHLLRSIPKKDLDGDIVYEVIRANGEHLVLVLGDFHFKAGVHILQSDEIKTLLK
jgi:hypothetical protein